MTFLIIFLHALEVGDRTTDKKGSWNIKSGRLITAHSAFVDDDLEELVFDFYKFLIVFIESAALPTKSIGFESYPRPHNIAPNTRVVR